MGDRPAKPVTEKMLLREFSEREGITPKTKKELPWGTKEKYAQFSRIRIRELTGRIPATTTYQVWLKSQSVQFQDDVLGKTKAVLFRKGNLPLDKFVNKAGDELTLSQLATTQAAYFRAAGLDPADYL